MENIFKHRALTSKVLILHILLTSGCTFASPPDCGTRLFNELNRMTVQEAKVHLNDLQTSMDHMHALDSLESLWNREFNKECTQLERISQHPLFRLPLASLLAQVHNNGFMELPVDEFYDYARSNIHSDQKKIVVESIAVLSFSNETEAKKLILRTMQDNPGNRLIIDAGILFLSRKCDPESDEFVAKYLMEHPDLQRDQRILGYLESSKEKCSR